MESIRAYDAADWDAVWAVLHPTIAAGDTLAFDPQSSQSDIHRQWVELPTATFVACDAGGAVCGTYYIKPNQPGLGSHVCNCGYVVEPRARGKGVAERMCRHSERRALSMGFAAMQFNLVVSSNDRAVRLWQTLGFTIVGHLPGAFQHRQLGRIDALVMFKTLTTAT